MNIELETDRKNLAEINAFYIAMAVKTYKLRQDEGYDVNHATAQAVAYLRRKTGWSAPIALGAFESALFPTTTEQ